MTNVVFFKFSLLKTTAEIWTRIADTILRSDSHSATFTFSFGRIQMES